MRRSKETRKQYIYLIQEREFVNSNEQTYKIGRTKSLLNRLSAYPKDSEVLMLCEVADCVTAEQTLKDRFRKEFTEQRQYGCEYFSGELGRMKSLISQTLFPSVKKTIKMMKPLPRLPNLFQRLSKKNNPPSKPLPQLPTIQNVSAVLALSKTKTTIKVKSPPTNKPQPWFRSDNKCHKCDEIFSTKQGLKRHLNRQYPCDYKCQQCDYVTTSTRQLNKHIVAEHPATEIPAVTAALARTKELSLNQAKGSLKFQLFRSGVLSLKKGFWIRKMKVVFYSDEFHSVIVVHFDEANRQLCYSCDSSVERNEFDIWHEMLQPEIDLLEQTINQHEQEVIQHLEETMLSEPHTLKSFMEFSR